ncbi:uncharacterized protein LOC131237706 [Magnolia sinica]|uniref:uncharacterized protein LOC131237706 n=1 Tax=Magnolia sinica TaxID=86752 RepID=UPI00265ADA9D|nr:uncharacterized protein LOC131237706 [Magnolia sinica]
MATSQPCVSLCGMSRPASLVQKVRRPLDVRAENSADKGKSMNIVDANMSVLRERIYIATMHERLQQYSRRGNGWNYPSNYNSNLKRNLILSQSLEIARLVVGTLGFTFLTGTLFLCLVSLVLHLGQ